MADIHWMKLNKQRRNGLMGVCGDNRFRAIEPYEIIPLLPDDLQQSDYSRTLDTSLVVKRVVPWYGTSTATVLMADLHRRDTGGYEIDQQPFLLAHISGASTPSDSGMFVNEGDWTGRTIRHFTGATPLDVLLQISNSDINNYYPGSGVIHDVEGSIDILFDTTYRHTLEYTLDLMRPRNLDKKNKL
jgi:hypothetical protein